MMMFVLTRSVPTLDRLVAAYAPLLPRVAGGGVFWLGAGHTAFWDVWTEGKSTTARLGRVELVIDRE